MMPLPNKIVAAYLLPLRSLPGRQIMHCMSPVIASEQAVSHNKRFQKDIERWVWANQMRQLSQEEMSGLKKTTFRLGSMIFIVWDSMSGKKYKEKLQQLINKINWLAVYLSTSKNNWQSSRGCLLIYAPISYVDIITQEMKGPYHQIIEETYVLERLQCPKWMDLASNRLDEPYEENIFAHIRAEDPDLNTTTQGQRLRIQPDRNHIFDDDSIFDVFEHYDSSPPLQAPACPCISHQDLQAYQQASCNFLQLHLKSDELRQDNESSPTIETPEQENLRPPMSAENSSPSTSTKEALEQSQAIKKRNRKANPNSTDLQRNNFPNIIRTAINLIDEKSSYSLRRLFHGRKDFKETFKTLLNQTKKGSCYKNKIIPLLDQLQQNGRMKRILRYMLLKTLRKRYLVYQLNHGRVEFNKLEGYIRTKNVQSLCLLAQTCSSI